MPKKAKKPEAKCVPTIYVRCSLGLKMRIVKACTKERRTEKEVVTAALEQYLHASEATP